MNTQRVDRMRAVRRFHRYLACETCGAHGGLACVRMPLPLSGVRTIANRHPHRGRQRTTERCADTDGGRRFIDCNLTPRHGGEWHYSRQGQRWEAT
jgi:hypothetical protein